MGKFIISEEERSEIRSKYGLINEQSEEVKFKKAIQCFLNKKGFKDNSNQPLKVDGLLAGKTAEALSKYQSKIGVYPSDGTWGQNTWDKMPERDRKLLKDLVAKEGGPIDRVLNWFGI